MKIMSQRNGGDFIKQRVRRTSCLPKLPPFLSDIIFISQKHSLLFCILYNLQVMFSMKKEREEEKITHKKNSYLTNFHPPPLAPPTCHM